MIDYEALRKLVLNEYGLLLQDLPQAFLSEVKRDCSTLDEACRKIANRYGLKPLKKVFEQTIKERNHAPHK
jgi:N-methylhydantoinase A/oxoprolinase/acetone carboxylase beta subunit